VYSVCGSQKLVLRYNYQNKTYHDKWVPVTTARPVLGLRKQKRPPIWRVAANILNKQSRTADKVWSCKLGVGRGTNKFHRKSCYVTKRSHDLSNGKRTWDLVRGCEGLYRSASLTTATREFARCIIDIVGVQEVRRDKGSTVIAEDYIFTMRKENIN
jgi:hypothetical protein